MRITKRLDWQVREWQQRRFMADLRSQTGVSVGPGAFVARAVKVEPEAEIGAGTWIGRHCALRGRSPLSIGKYCEFGEGVEVHTSNHELKRANISGRLQRAWTGDGFPIATRGPVRIGNGVWVGNGAQILSGVTIGDGAVIGAAAVVTRDVEPFTIAAGVPARPLRKRFEEDVIAELLAIAWWDWPEEQIRDSQEFFEADLTSENAVDLLRSYRDPQINQFLTK